MSEKNRTPRGGDEADAALHGDPPPESLDDTEDAEEHALAAKDRNYEAGHAPGRRRRSVGITKRRMRVRVRAREIFLEKRRDWLNASEKQREARDSASAIGADLPPEPEPFVEQAVLAEAAAEALQVPMTPRELTMYYEYAPGLLYAEAVQDVHAATGRPVSRKVVWAAVNRHPLVRFLRGYLARRTNVSGPRAARKLLSCAMLLMSFGRGRPCLQDAALDFEGDPLLAWAFEYPHDDVGCPPMPPGGGFWGSFKTMVEFAHNDIPIAIQLEAWMELAQAKGIDENGNEVRLYPRAGEVLVIDYSFVEADVEQHGTKDDDDVLDRLYNGPKRLLVRFVRYAFRKKNRGYKAGTLLDLDTMASPRTKLGFGAVNESKDMLEMVQRLLEMETNFPAIVYIVGDRLFQHDTDAAKALLWRFGIIPVFPARADDPDAKDELPQWSKLERRWDAGEDRPPWLLYRGVPHCTRCHVPMRLEGWADKFWSQQARIDSIQRRKEGTLKHGERWYRRDEWVGRAERRARLRFICDGCFKLQNGRTLYTNVAHVRPDDDPRVFRVLPYCGPAPESLGRESEPVVRRKVLLGRRNGIESYYAALQRLGVAGKGGERPKWADSDETMAWHIELAVAYLTLRKLVLVNGAYEFALGQAQRLGLLKPLTRRNPGTLLRPEAIEQAEAAWDQQVGPARVPRYLQDELGRYVFPVPFSEDGNGGDWPDPFDVGVRGEPPVNAAVAAGRRSIGATEPGGASDTDDPVTEPEQVVSRARRRKRARRVPLDPQRAPLRDDEDRELADS